MSFISLTYLLFFPTISLLYFLLPHKVRWILLVVGSYFFYMCWNVNYAFLMLLSTAITYASGLLMEIIENKTNLPKKAVKQQKKLILALSLVSNLGILFFFKYFNFLNSSVADLFSKFHIEWGFQNINILLPVGISFYTFQALSYSIDVYSGKIDAVKHFGKYALYVSFFPQLVAGPIERSWHLLPQFDKRMEFDYNRVRAGLGLLVWGVFKKVVIANRLAVVVNTVYTTPEKYYGVEIAVATIFFAFQIYADFSAYTDIARGSAKILGFDLMNNFYRPYFATSIPQFWRRWHISLTTWFRDYLYIPLGGNRVSKARWYLNIMLVFIVSGLWHGAAWTFVIWGFLHGIYQLIDIQSRNWRLRFNRFAGIDPDQISMKIFKIIWTFFLVCVAWIFFRAGTIENAMLIIRQALVFNPWKIVDGSLYSIGLDSKDFNFSILLIFSLLLCWFIERKTSISERVFREYFLVRHLVYIGLIFLIVIFGYYGPQFDESQFIYFQF